MDGDLGWLWILAGVVMFMSMAKGGRLSREQRKLQDRFERFQATPPAPPPALPGPTREEVARLEQRVRVLERIVTDNGYALASQIEALRDSTQAEERSAAKIEESI